MKRNKLDPRILKKLEEITKGKMTRASIRVALSEIRRDHPRLTLNAAAQVFARKRNSSIARWLKQEDRETLTTFKFEKITQGDGTKIYIITERDTLEKFQFASRSYVWPQGIYIPEPTEQT